MDGAGVPVEFSKGEAGRGQHEINLRYADALEMADRHTIYKNGAKEIAALNDRAITFMAKYTMDECGISCHLHSSLWGADGDEPLDWDEGAPDHMSETFRYYLGGLLATRAESCRTCSRRTSTRTSGTNPGRGRRPRSCGVGTTAPAASASWATAPGSGSNHGSRGATATPISPTRPRSPPGCTASSTASNRGPSFVGNAYEAEDVPRVPSTLVEAMGELEGSELAAKAFGEDVHFHLVNTARQEWAASNRVVTDWELRRSFELA